MRAQFQVVDSLLSQASPGPLAAPGPTEPQEPPAATPVATERPHKETKKQLEDALAALPQLPETQAARQALQQQLDAVVARIREAAPPGARLDGAMAALQRARARRQAALDAQQKAQAALAAADQECAQLQKDVDAIRQAMASLPALPDATSALVQLQAATKAAVEALRASGHADPGHLQQAIEHSTQLVTGFEATLAHAQRVAAMQHGSLPQRLVGKQELRPPEPPSEPARVRHNGKQAPMRSLVDLFASPVTKKVSLVGKVESGGPIKAPAFQPY